MAREDTNGQISTLWRTIALSLLTLLLGLGGSFVTVEIRLTNLRADVGYLQRQVAELQGISTGRMKELESMRTTDLQIGYQTKAFDESIKDLNRRLHEMDLLVTRMGRKIGIWPGSPD